MKAQPGDVMKEMKTSSIAVAWASSRGRRRSLRETMDDAIRQVAEMHDAKSVL